MILNFWTDRSQQTVQTQIRLHDQTAPDQGLHCLQFCLHLSETLLYDKASLFRFLGNYSKFLGFLWYFNPSHAANSIAVNATAAGFISKKHFPLLCR